VAGSLSKRGAQFLRSPVAIRDEGGIATQAHHQPGRAALASVQVAGKMHTADHALPCVFRRARQQLRAPLGQHVRQ